MPKEIIASMKHGYEGSGLSEEEVNHRVYGKLNKEGAMRGSKMTAKGARMEEKYERDHSRGRRRRGKVSSEEAAETLAARD